ncbi:P450 monooxygenase [Penicillium malachiteum]|uniref:P450 monooxygenase n=1 Tax=Penicillium malachiteum TaxID=1324776 RepID=UPI002546BFDC|nr:P450 monooxygenase [Penicillium malachiteum]KAJ5721031.1 P450 monooxygenase [Penicillium malachiteum]
MGILSEFDSPLSQVLAGPFKVVTITNILLLTIAFAMLQFLYQIIYYKLFHPLKRYPGPFWASVTRLWQAWHFFQGSELDAQWQAVKKYGPVVRVSPTMLLVTDSTLLPTLYHRRDVKSKLYISEYFETPGSILIRDPTKHAGHRRLVGATYSLSNIMRMEPLLDKHISKWLNKVKCKFAEDQKPLDYPMWSSFLSYDTITDVAFRNPLGFIDTESDVGGLMKAFRVGSVALGLAGRLHTFFSWLPQTWLRRYILVQPEQTQGFGVIFKQAKSILHERTQALAEGRTIKPQKGDGSYDFLQAPLIIKSFMDTSTPEGELLTSQAIQNEVFVILGAGTEGFSSMSSAFFAEILSRPIILERLLAEIKAAVEAGKLSQPVPTYTEVSQGLPFFVACFRETMRIHPTGAAMLPRQITADGPELILNGFKIPPGIEIGANPWICHRDKAIYGEDAEEFNPDRWLGDPAQVKIFEKYNLGWGYGSRVCLGKHFALMMLYKAPVALLMQFEASLCSETLDTPKYSVRPYGATLNWKDVWVDLRTRDPWISTNGHITHAEKNCLERPHLEIAT